MHKIVSDGIDFTRINTLCEDIDKLCEQASFWVYVGKKEIREFIQSKKSDGYMSPMYKRQILAAVNKSAYKYELMTYHDKKRGDTFSLVLSDE